VRGRTAFEMMIRAGQSIRGRILVRRMGLGASSAVTRVHSFGWSGKLRGLDLQAFTAQVRKLRVRIFIFAGVGVERVSGFAVG
jgi:hypothetical protein